MSWKLIGAGIIIVLLFGGGLYVGYRAFSPSQTKTTVSADVILTALRDRGFLVTQTVVFDEPVTINKTSGSALKDFFFGQTITARGAMEVNLGTDLSKLSASNVAINGDTVTVTIPAASVFDVHALGPIEVKNDQGILKQLLENDTGYNDAVAELSRQAEAAAKKPEILDEATAHAKDEITRLLGYVAQGKKIQINVAP